ncbi:MAG: iron donor protein CyaY [Rugosibacter sp.]|nr:iron donor protein CyaY [Rugosibacter sp.]
MDEHDFIQLADQELAQIEASLDKACALANAELDVETKPGGVIEIECNDGANHASKVIINRHVAAREIWVAAKSGGYHFRPQNGTWLATRDGEPLREAIARVLSEQTGEIISLSL